MSRKRIPLYEELVGLKRETMIDLESVSNFLVR